MPDQPTTQFHNYGAMSVDQFAKWAGIGRTLAWEQISDGALQALKVGRRTLITTAAAEHWLASLPTVQISGGRDAA